jgi:hypothetical protein
MRTIKLLATVTVLLVATPFVRAQSPANPSAPPSPKSMRIVSLESVVKPDGSSTIRSVNIRWVTEAGAWKLIKLDAQGRSNVAMYSDAEVSSQNPGITRWCSYQPLMVARLLI